jgi:hypothetical protein
MTAAKVVAGCNIAEQPTYFDLTRENAELRRMVEELKTALDHERFKRRKLEWQISQLLNQKFNPSSEKISIEQLELLLESLNETSTEAAPAPDAAPAAVETEVFPASLK